jgi:hypothetical protein
MIELSTSSGGEETKSKNFFTETITIVDAKVHYNETQKWRKFPDDIGLTLTLDIGRDFQPEWYLGGSYKKDEVSGEITGWSTVFGGVACLFRSVGMPIQCPKGQSTTSAIFPEQLIEGLKGKQVCRLKYKSSKRMDKNGVSKWVEFNNTEKPGNDEALSAKFLKDINENYVKDFLDPNSSVESHPLEGAVADAFGGNDLSSDLPV